MKDKNAGNSNPLIIAVLIAGLVPFLWLIAGSAIYVYWIF